MIECFILLQNAPMLIGAKLSSGSFTQQHILSLDFGIQCLCNIELYLFKDVVISYV